MRGWWRGACLGVALGASSAAWAQPPARVRDLRARIAADPALADDGVRVDNAGLVLVVAGDVDTPEEHDRVLAMAREAADGAHMVVSDDLRVTEVPSRDDGRTLTRSLAAHVGDAVGPAVVVAIDGGVATISGTAASERVRLQVLQSVARMPGVRRIADSLRVQPPPGLTPP